MYLLKRKFTLLAILLSILIGGLYSLRWTIPLVFETKHKDYSYLPVRYYANSESDDYFYYSRIREIINLNFFSGDHATLENKTKITPHATYTLSFMAGSIAGIVTSKTQYAYYFNFFFFPTATLFLLMCFARYFQLGFIFSSAASVYAVLASTQFMRTPNILLTTFSLIGFAFITFKKLELKDPSRKLDIFLILILGLSSITSMPNMFICYGIFITSLALYWNDGINRRGYLKILIASIVLSLPGILIILQNILGHSEEWFGLAIPPLSKYSGIHQKFITPIKHFFINPFLVVFLIFQFPKKKYLLSCFLGMLLVYLFLTLTKGSFTSYYVYHRGGEVLYRFLIICGSALLINETLINGEVKILKWTFSFPLISKFNSSIRLIINGSVAIALSYFIYNKSQDFIHDAQNRVTNYNVGEFKHLTDWTTTNTKADEAIVSLDFDLITNIGVYSPADTYLAFAHHSPVSTAERHKRLFESLAFHGVTVEQFESLLKNMKGHGNISSYKTPEEIDGALMQLILFYGPYTNDAMPRDAINKMVLEYALAKKSYRGFSYRANFVIVTDLTERLINPTSHLAALIKQTSPIYNGKKYKVYPLAEPKKL